jgi:hypothetical protein
MPDQPTPVRLIVADDCGSGFQLTPHVPLDDVLPGGEYVTECMPQHAVVIREIVVHGFQLLRICVGTREVETTLRGGGENRQYRLEPPLQVAAGENIRMRLHNDAGWSRKPKLAVLIREGPP